MFESALHASEVDELLFNTELRTELEFYFDETVNLVDSSHFPLRLENDFLACLLEWETAPVLPIYRWFEPEMRLPHPDNLSEKDLPTLLSDVIDRLYDKQIVLDFTDHLSDLELYRIIYQDILPTREKKLKHRCGYIHWDCSYIGNDPTTWLAYYASDDDRELWSDTSLLPLPPKMIPPYQRDLPSDPIW